MRGAWTEGKEAPQKNQIHRAHSSRSRRRSWEKASEGASAQEPAGRGGERKPAGTCCCWHSVPALLPTGTCREPGDTMLSQASICISCYAAEIQGHTADLQTRWWHPGGMGTVSMAGREAWRRPPDPALPQPRQMNLSRPEVRQSQPTYHVWKTEQPPPTAGRGREVPKVKE